MSGSSPKKKNSHKKSNNNNDNNSHSQNKKSSNNNKSRNENKTARKSPKHKQNKNKSNTNINKQQQQSSTKKTDTVSQQLNEDDNKDCCRLEKVNTNAYCNNEIKTNFPSNGSDQNPTAATNADEAKEVFLMRENEDDNAATTSESLTQSTSISSKNMNGIKNKDNDNDNEDEEEEEDEPNTLSQEDENNIFSQVDDEHIDLPSPQSELEAKFEDLARLSYEQENQIQSQNKLLSQNTDKIRELETALCNAKRECLHLDGLLKQQLARKITLENENLNLNVAINRIKSQLSSLEKVHAEDKEKISILSATVIERDTEISILKLKLTRLQTNVSVNVSATKNTITSHTSRTSELDFSKPRLINQPVQDFVNTISSRTSLQSFDRDSSLWAHVPEELCPNTKPEVLQEILKSDEASLSINQTSTPRRNTRLYRTLPVQRKAQCFETSTLTKDSITNSNTVVQDNIVDDTNLDKLKVFNALSSCTRQCQITNLDDSSSTNQSVKTSDVQLLEPEKDLTISHQDTKPSQEPSNEDTAIVSVQKDKQPQEHIDTLVESDQLESELPIRKSSLPKMPASPVKQTSGLKRFFEKFKRSSSSISEEKKPNANNSHNFAKHSLHQEQIISAGLSPFRRGPSQGRSTMHGPSSVFSTPLRQIPQTNKPFAEWNSEMVADWLVMIGLSMYANQCRRWIDCGIQIMNATSAEVDKGLGISSPLHRKKLRLAISELNGDCDSITKAASKLDYLCVAKWLDDIGLPQYKDKFIEARIDGRVLNYLTVDDLLSMDITSVLHHSSIKCSIKVLRSLDFEIEKLRRRARVEELTDQAKEDEVGECELAYWTCHRVMEWLRSIEFAEYSSNLRGSGLNGALIVYEDAFNSDTMCCLLSIAENKTLLRRHLKGYFCTLVGKDLSARKHLHQSSATSVPLTPSAEIKTHKKFSLLRLKSSKVSQDSTDEYLCPMYPPDPRLLSPSLLANQ